MFKVDLNADLGESFGAYTIGCDEAVLSEVTSANVACGWHAGDPLVLDRTLALAKAKGAGTLPDHRSLQILPPFVAIVKTAIIAIFSCQGAGLVLQSSNTVRNTVNLTAL